MKNKVLTSILLIAVFAMVSCNKKVTVKTSEVDGPLKGAFEVVEKEYEVEEDSEGNTIVRVEVTRTDNTVPYTKDNVKAFGAKKASGALTLAGFGYVGLDDKNHEICEVEAPDNTYNPDNQLKVLKMKNDDTRELIIKLDPDKLPDVIRLTSDVQLVNTGNINFYGAIGKYKVKNWTMGFDFKTGKNSGKYQYQSSPAGSYLYLRGNTKKASYYSGPFYYSLTFVEDNGGGLTSGDFNGSIKLERNSPTAPYQYVISGWFTNFQGKGFSCDLKSAPIK